MVRDFYAASRFDPEYFEGRRDCTPCLTGADWSANRAPTGRAYGYRWVQKRPDNRTKDDWPYSYSDHFVLGEVRKGDEAVYSDRLQQWSNDNWTRAWAAMGDRKGFNQFSYADANKFMSAYLGKDAKVSAIAEGCNVSSGYPYWIIWYHEVAR